jgi:hypothetical protein
MNKNGASRVFLIHKALYRASDQSGAVSDQRVFRIVPRIAKKKRDN